MLVGCLEVDGKLVQNGPQAEPFCLQTHLKTASKWSGTKMEQLPLPVFSLSIILELHKGPAQGAFEIPPPQPFAGVAQLARAFGSYPECHWFESDRRYQVKTVQVAKLGRFLFVCVALKISVFSITSSSYTSPTHPKWHKLGIFLMILRLKVQYFYTSKPPAFRLQKEK